MVEIQNVAFGYDAARPVLRDVSLSIERGSVVGIMGQSGCGKTTLLRIIAAQYLPTSGTARVLGEATSGLDREALYRMRRRMGMLFQFGALFTDMSVYENVAFPLREHTALPEDLIHDLVMLKLQAVGLRGAAQLMPAELSRCGARPSGCRPTRGGDWRGAWPAGALSPAPRGSSCPRSRSPASTRFPSA